MTSSPDPGVRLTIESRFEELEKVHGVIRELGLRHELDEDSVNALLVAVIEAGTNAIQHGNVFARDKTVGFQFTVLPEEILVRVDDFGKGFDPAKVPNPTEGEQLLNPHGRGLYLMRSLMDEVTVRSRPDKGTTVLLRKFRPTPPAPSGAGARGSA